MNDFFPKLFFSIAVTLSMNALDIIYHLVTSWTVHLNYVGIKLTLIFLSAWMITQFIGIGKEEGIAASMLGPLMFYIYYVFAGDTLNREIFRLDEQFWFIFLHMLFMLIAYFATLNFLASKKGLIKNISFVIIATLTPIALHALFIMLRWRINGIDEETAASMMTFSLIIAPIIAYSLGNCIALVIERIIKNKIAVLITAAIIPTIIIGVSVKEIYASVFAFVFVVLTYFMLNTFEKRLSGMVKWKRKTG